VVIKGNLLSKRCQDIRYDHRVRFNQIDRTTFQFRYPYDPKSDVFIILEDDGIWLTVSGKPEHRYTFRRQQDINKTLECAQ